MANISVVAEFAGDNLKLLQQGVGIIFNGEISQHLKKDLRSIVTDQQQRLIAVVAGAGATAERTANEKAILYESGFSDLIYVQPTLALAAYFGYKFTEAMPVMVVVIGEDATDLAIILGDKTLYSGILDIGVNSAIDAIIDYVAEKYQVDINFTTAHNILADIGSLLPNDSRFVKFPEFIIKAEQVREIVYPLYAQIIGAINHLLSEASVDVIRQINNTGVVFGGIGAGIRGLSAAVYSVIGLQSLIAEDENNACLIGAGTLLEQPKTFLNLTQNA